MGLLADDAIAADFLYLAITISDNPVASQKLGWLVAIVADSDRIRKYVMVVERIRLLLDVGRHHFYVYFVGIPSHGIIIPPCTLLNYPTEKRYFLPGNSADVLM
jgi:hypothetical protein